MFLKILILTFYLIFASKDLLAAKSNVQIIDSAYSEAAQSYISYLSQNSISSIYVNYENNSNSLLENKILKFAKDKNIKILASSENNTPTLNLLVKENSIVYKWLDNDNADSLKREILVSISAYLKNKESVIALSDYGFYHSDILSEAEAKESNNSSLPYSKGNIPPSPVSLISAIAKPILFIAGTALTVYLLFTVRSK